MIDPDEGELAALLAELELARPDLAGCPEEQLAASVMQISQCGICEGMILAYARHGARWL